MDQCFVRETVQILYWKIKIIIAQKTVFMVFLTNFCEMRFTFRRVWYGVGQKKKGLIDFQTKRAFFF